MWVNSGVVNNPAENQVLVTTQDLIRGLFDVGIITVGLNGVAWEAIFEWLNLDNSVKADMVIPVPAGFQSFKIPLRLRVSPGEEFRVRARAAVVGSVQAIILANPSQHGVA